VPKSSEDGSESLPEKDRGGIRAFLIADVRGYTSFTQERGDEAAAKLAEKFASIARAGVQDRGGSLIELRGDEALAAFPSPREAIRAALELQARFRRESGREPSLALPVGIGIDVGEAVPVEGGYRGGALNLAARLCSLAGAGEIVASREVVHLARKIEGVRYHIEKSVRLKGLSEPVDLARVILDDADPADLAPFHASDTSPPARSRRRPVTEEVRKRGPDEREEVVGREPELELVRRFVDALKDEAGALVLRGEAGIGKTTLWRAALSVASQRNYPIVSCRPAKAETDMPFAAVGDLLDGVLEEVLPELPAPQRQALEVALLLSPVEGRVVDQRSVSLAVLTALRLIADERPLVAAVDDVQWLDRPSRRVLEFVARRLDGTRIGLLLGVRGEAEEPAPLGLDGSLAPDRMTVIDLRGLPVETIDALLRARLGTGFPRRALVELMRVSKGNPFFALELGRAVLRQGVSPSLGGLLPVPRNLRQLVAARLARLSHRERTALLAATALSHPTVDLVSAATGSDAVAVLERTRERGIVELSEGRIEFAHPLLASTVYADAADVERRTMHQRLATVVRDPVEAARHLALGTDVANEEVARAVEEAARVARARGAPETAADLAEAASRLTPADNVEQIRLRQVEAGEYHLFAGDRDQARIRFQEAISGAAPGVIRTRATYGLALVHFSDPDHKRGVAALLVAAIEAQDDPLLSATIQSELAVMLSQSGQVRAAERHAHLALVAAESAENDTVLAWALTVLTWVKFVLGRGYARELLERAVALTAGHGVGEGGPYPTHALLEQPESEAMILRWSDRFARARDRLKELRDRRLERHEKAVIAPVLFTLGELECWAGNWDTAEEYAEECRQVVLRWGGESDEWFLTVEATVAALRGDVSHARTIAERALEAAEAATNVPFVIRSLSVLGFLELSLGNAAEARLFYDRAMSMALDAGYLDPGIFRFQADVVEALVGTGEIDAAHEIVDRLETQGRELDRPWALVAAARGRGLVAAARRHLDGAKQALEEALVHHERLEMPFELARTLMVLGSVQRRLKQKRAARESLSQALELFSRLGARVWAERAGSELGRIGGRAPAPHDLSPTEQEIARLASRGLTNKEIGASLFMSAKTVERHLSHVFAKLGIFSRRELVLQKDKDS
jgi:class 3 adenylate cyclase/DNA-binding CsgD family transcriptional regulator/exonuclease VII small subunit